MGQLTSKYLKKILSDKGYNIIENDSMKTGFYCDYIGDERGSTLALRTDMDALAIDEKVLGPEHPSTATALSNLGLLYLRQGLYEKAEPLYLRALAISEQALGSENEESGSILNNIGMLYIQQGLYEKAEPLFFRALDI